MAANSILTEQTTTKIKRPETFRNFRQHLKRKKHVFTIWLV